MQANRYEGLVVWLNAMVESAGTESSPGRASRARAGADRAGARADGRARQLRAPPTRRIDDLQRGHRAALLRGGQLELHAQLPVRLPERQGERARRLQEHRRRLPAGRPEQAEAPPLGGINLGVSSYSENKDQAFEAIECMIQPANQIEIAERGRPAAGARGPLRREGDREGLSRLRRPDPRVDRRRRAAPGVARLPGPLAGDPAHDPPDRPTSPPTTRARPTRSSATTSSRRSTGRGCSEEARAARAGEAGRRRSPTATRAERKLGWMLCAPAVSRCCSSPPIRSSTRSSSRSRTSTCASPTSAASSGSTTTSTCSPRPVVDGRRQHAFITVVSVAIEFVLGMGIALLMHRAIFGRGVVRTSVLIPYGIVTVVAAFAWFFAFHPTPVRQPAPFVADDKAGSATASAPSRDHHRRGLEDDPVHGPAAARRPDDDRRRPLRGGEGRRRERRGSASSGSPCR